MVIEQSQISARRRLSREQWIEMLVAFLSIAVTVILVVIIIGRYPKISIPLPGSTTSPTPTNTSGVVALDLASVEKHNTPGDCWIIVNNEVYAVSTYLSRHPGGAGIIIPYCGRDATQVYITRAGTGGHSSRANSELATLRLGTLGSTTTPQAVNQATNSGSNLPDGRYYDDD